MPFTFQTLGIPDVVLITPKTFADERGFFLEFYRRDEFVAAGVEDEFVQYNHSGSSRGVLRGLHFQRGAHAQGKLVRCLAGEIFDVVLDIRPSSSSFGQWVAVNLQPPRMLYVPAGFAHGFAAVSERAEILYMTSRIYCSSAEGGVSWDDPDLAIPWPVESPILSPRDRQWPRLKDLAQ